MKGDSGGPLECEQQIIGIVSHGVGCGLQNRPGIYIDVFYFSDWIEENKNNSNKIKFNLIILLITGIVFLKNLF